MIFVALAEAASKGELLLVQDGMCRWHRRRDGVVVIREILVLPGARRMGIGKHLVSEVVQRSRGAVIRAKCPVKYVEANLFWSSMGFVLTGEEDGVNSWEGPAAQH